MRARVVADTETNRVGVRPGWAAEFGLQTRLEQKVDIQDILFFFYEVLIVFAGNVDIPERLLLSATRHLVDCPSTQSSSEARKRQIHHQVREESDICHDTLGSDQARVGSGLIGVSVCKALFAGQLLQKRSTSSCTQRSNSRQLQQSSTNLIDIWSITHSLQI